MVCHQVHVALLSFFTSLLTTALSEHFIMAILHIHSNYECSLYWIQLLNYGILSLIVKLISNATFHDISVRSYFLGCSFYSGVLLYGTTTQSWRMFGVYTVVLSTFHFTEFLAIAFTNPTVLSCDTFVINHSTAYTLAAGASWIEYLIEKFYFPKMKQCLWIPLIGLIFCAIGEILRKAAIFTAKQNFNHMIQSEKTNDHKLVTHGVYKVCRHPSYVGWFYWSIGTQLILQNPFCCSVYAFISWKFFQDRIFIEEYSLVNFFGHAYVQYQKKVGTGLPFILGYKDYRYK